MTGGPSLTASEWARVPSELQAQYQPLSDVTQDVMLQRLLENPALVVDAIQSALTDRSPPM